MRSLAADIARESLVTDERRIADNRINRAKQAGFNIEEVRLHQMAVPRRKLLCHFG